MTATPSPGTVLVVRQLLPAPVEVSDLAALYAATEGDTTLVRVNLAGTPDGVASLGGTSDALSSRADRQLLGVLRSLADVVLVGANTARAENYRGVRRTDARTALRAKLQKPPVPPVAVVTASGNLDRASRLFTDTEMTPIVVTTESAVKKLRQLPDVVACGGDSVELPVMLTEFRRRGLFHVLCEGGPSLFTQLLAADLVDELCLTISPVLAGGGHHRLTAETPLIGTRPLAIRHVLADGDWLFLRYLLPRSGSSSVTDSSRTASLPPGPL